LVIEWAPRPFMSIVECLFWHPAPPAADAGRPGAEGGTRNVGRCLAPVESVSRSSRPPKGQTICLL